MTNRSLRRGIIRTMLIAGLAAILAAIPSAAASGRATPKVPIFAAQASGRVLPLGTAADHGSVHPPLRAPIIAIGATHTGKGYWLTDWYGDVFAYGDAHWFGDLRTTRLDRPVVGIAPTVSGHGYWLAASDGGVFSFGDAHFHGSAANFHLDQPVVGITATPTGHGYWLVARDGGVFSFGDARFHGSAARYHLGAPIAAMASSSGGRGYWLAGRDGGVFPFGTARFHGSAVGAANWLTVGIVPTRSGGGYWIASASGGLRSFGNATGITSPRPTALLAGIATPWSSSSGLAQPLLELVAGLHVAQYGVWPGPHQAALTFDDGPSAYTQDVLAALTARDVPATFFVVGEEAAARPDALRAEAAAGMAVEDHTWDHADLTRLDPAAIRSELERDADEITAVTGRRPTCFRPPYGATNSTVREQAGTLGLQQVLWNVDPSDYLRPGASTIAARVLSTANGSGLLIGIHDGGGDRSQTVAALPAIIDGLRARGYTFVRLC